MTDAARPGAVAPRETDLFLLIAFGWSWAVAGLISLAGGLASPWFAPLAILFMAGPMVAAIVCAAMFDKGRRVRALGLKPHLSAQSWLWLLLAWVLPVLLVVFATLVDWVGPASPQDPGVPLGTT